MDCQIYLITDCDNKKYVGKTTHKLKYRLTRHKADKNLGDFCSSSLLNLHNCKIELLATCKKEDSQELEKFYINKIDCVNIIKYKGYRNEREIKYEKSEKRKKSKSEWNKKKYIYVNSWGGDIRNCENNNLLRIDTNLFN